MEYRDIHIVVRFADGIQREFKLQATSIEGAILDIQDAYQMDCTLEGIYRGFVYGN